MRTAKKAKVAYWGQKILALCRCASIKIAFICTLNYIETFLYIISCTWSSIGKYVLSLTLIGVLRNLFSKMVNVLRPQTLVNKRYSFPQDEVHLSWQTNVLVPTKTRNTSLSNLGRLWNELHDLRLTDASIFRVFIHQSEMLWLLQTLHKFHMYGIPGVAVVSKLVEGVVLLLLLLGVSKTHFNALEWNQNGNCSGARCSLGISSLLNREFSVVDSIRISSVVSNSVRISLKTPCYPGWSQKWLSTEMRHET